jgi:hypothetical protein
VLCKMLSALRMSPCDRRIRASRPSSVVFNLGEDVGEGSRGKAIGHAGGRQENQRALGHLVSLLLSLHDAHDLDLHLL